MSKPWALKSLIVIIWTLSSPGVRGAATLIEVGESADVTSVVSKAEDLDEIYAVKAKKRAGVGVSLMGWSGFMGVNLELNYLPDHGARIAVGGGPGYQSIALGWKWTPMDTEIHPILGFGVADWFGRLSSDRPDPAPPSFLSERLVTSEDRLSGNFDKFFLVPTLGIEWLQTSGPGIGSGIFLEMMILIEARSFQQYLTGDMGVIYYF